MPEIPEVQALTEALAARTLGHRILRVGLADLSALKTVDPPLLGLRGAVVDDIARRGKFIIWSLVSTDGEQIFMVIHLSRAGWMRWVKEPSATPPRPGKGPLALRLTFGNVDESVIGAVDITEAGTQKRLSIYVVSHLDDVPGIHRLGPDPLDAAFSHGELALILDNAGGKQIKGVLRDQSVIAGIGNAYSDEILHAAKLSPYAAAGKLTEEQRAALFDAIQTTLRAAIARAAGSAPETLKAEKKSAMAVHGRAGEACPVCGDTVREVSFASSSLQYCPTCQTGGTVLADRRMSRLLR
ncbi:MAG: Fpg/Nei family DNA glycosylase [Actinobacteria bacterium]|nr:Fpg/Nei family DNA glycosylase [Actinomycetota bacterium]